MLLSSVRWVCIALFLWIVATITTTTIAMSSPPAAAAVRKVAIIGGGAAGLAASRVFSREGIEDVTVLEANSQTTGGVWKHRANSKTTPMYRGLRTNLPKEIMQYREYPWKLHEENDDTSYVTHGQVLEYLQNYQRAYDLTKMVRYGCKVTRVTVVDEEQDTGTGFPKFSLQWQQQETEHEDVFDAVCVCNGHYALPARSNVPGIDENFQGTILHSIEYDDPSEFADMVVLCIGGRASGADLAREISMVAKKVHLSDTTCRRSESLENVVWVPKTTCVEEDSSIRFGSEDEDEESLLVSDIDVIIFCSGYDYRFPFLEETSGSNLELSCVRGERRVSPLYRQLWHAKHPNLSFIGLPHSVVPFPLFEFQAEAIAAQWKGNSPNPLPPLQERLDLAKEDAEAGGPNGKRVQDTHYLGSFQWEYCRDMAKISGVYDEAVENYIATNQAIYDDASQQRKGLFPGGPDDYRGNCYMRKDEEQSFQRFLASATNTAETAY